MVEGTVTETITLTIDGLQIEVPRGTTIWDAARQAGIDIPVLCHDERLPPVGVCRVCLVDVGETRLTASCIREAADGMTVATTNDKIERARKGLVELLLSDYPDDSPSGAKTSNDELAALAAKYGIERPKPRTNDAIDARRGLAPQPAPRAPTPRRKAA